ncbi:hypothetical protein AAES_62883 [Amazona aestiva]|uniref:Uncharacterized protein n=1 Tax=Amazona aestiva TaxID=12930 RepID=A0A0Q3PQ03_AMAAE|nr:hypothetical protein AAES_62883 [Amazona aestiva]
MCRGDFYPDVDPRNARKTSPSTKRGERRKPANPRYPPSPISELASKPVINRERTAAAQTRSHHPDNPRGAGRVPSHSPVPSGAAFPDDRSLLRALSSALGKERLRYRGGG